MQVVHCAIYSEVQGIPAILPVHQTTTITLVAVAVVAAAVQVLRAVVVEVHRSVSFKGLPSNLSVVRRKGYSKLLLSLIYDS